MRSRKQVENVKDRKPRMELSPKLECEDDYDEVLALTGYVVDTLCNMLRIMFISLCISSEYKFQLNWILMKQDSVLPTQKLRVIRDILVESVLNIRSMYAYP